MEARRVSRPVSTVFAYSLLTMDAGPPGPRPATSWARGPPSSLRRADTSSPRVHSRSRPRKGERRCANITSPVAGLAKLVLVTASYVTW
jgi:hypothetical protein